MDKGTKKMKFPPLTFAIEDKSISRTVREENMKYRETVTLQNFHFYWRTSIQSTSVSFHFKGWLSAYMEGRVPLAGYILQG